MSPLAVWHVDLSPAGDGEWLRPMLSGAERHRSKELAGSRREEYLNSHAAARLILGGLTGRRPSSLRWQCSAAGKPGPVSGTTWHWNLSHASGRALVAVRANGPVGVDLVRVDELRQPVRIAERFFSAAEADRVRTAASPDQACARLLARKEACLKSSGLRLADGLAIEVDGGNGHDGAGRRWAVLDLAAPPGWAAAVAAPDAGPLSALEHHWEWPRPGRWEP
jgi:4'-phosphopantetheinyl transferase